MHKIFHDSVHGDVVVKKEEEDIIHTWVFQRMHWIRQLGLAHLVYHDAVHTRFEHSIGSLQMAHLILRSLQEKEYDISDDDVSLVRAAALLHDVTHIPFGHTLEDEIGLYERHDAGESGGQRLDYFFAELDKGVQRDTTREILAKVKPILKLMMKGGSEERTAVPGTTPDEKAVGGKPEVILPAKKRFIVDIVGNTICADLLDYVQRDAQFCGLKLPFDYRIFGWFQLAEDENGNTRLAIALTKDKFRIDRVSAIIDVLRGRYALAERVYFHHAKCAASAMLGKAFTLAGCPPESGLYRKADPEIFGYLESTVADFRDQDKKRAVERLVQKLRSRRLHKTVFRVLRKENDSYYSENHQTLGDRFRQPQTREDFELRIGKELSSLGSVIVYCPDEDMSLKESAVMVLPFEEAQAVPLNSLKEKDIPAALCREIEALEQKYRELWSMQIILDEEDFDQAAMIEAQVRERLNVRNDPLLVQALRKKPQYIQGLQILKNVSGIRDKTIPKVAEKLRTAPGARGKGAAPSLKALVHESVQEVLDENGLVTGSKRSPRPRKETAQRSSGKQKKEGPPEPNRKEGSLFDKNETSPQ